MPGNKRKWTAEWIEREKRAINAELREHSHPQKPSERLKYALNRIVELESSGAANSGIQIHLLIVSSLLHHSRHGGLTAPQIKRLIHLDHAVLNSAGIAAADSRIGSVYGDLHLAIAHVHSRHGENMSAAWEHGIATSLARRDRRDGFALLSLGLRAQRLGDFAFGIAKVAEAERVGLGPKDLARARLERVRMLRLAGRTSEAIALSRDALQNLTLDAAFKKEFDWEMKLSAVAEPGWLQGLASSVRRGQSHNEFSYAAEVWLLTRATESREFLDKYPTLRSLARSAEVLEHSSTLLFRATQALELIYQPAVPILNKMRSVGEILAQKNQFTTIDLEMTFLCAIGRWLARTHRFSLARHCLFPYASASLAGSSGKTNDMLRIASDLLDRDWYVNPGLDVPIAKEEEEEEDALLLEGVQKGSKTA